MDRDSHFPVLHQGTSLGSTGEPVMLKGAYHWYWPQVRHTYISTRQS